MWGSSGWREVPPLPLFAGTAAGVFAGYAALTHAGLTAELLDGGGGGAGLSSSSASDLVVLAEKMAGVIEPIVSGVEQALRQGNPAEKAVTKLWRITVEQNKRALPPSSSPPSTHPHTHQSASPKQCCSCRAPRRTCSPGRCQHPELRGLRAGLEGLPAVGRAVPGRGRRAGCSAQALERSAAAVRRASELGGG